MATYLVGVYTSFFVIALGIWAMVTKDNIIKKIIALGVLDSGVVLLFVSYGFREDAGVPKIGGIYTRMVDPLPQALMLTAIVIGVSLMALGLAIAVRLHERYGTLDMSKIEEHDRERDRE